MNSRTGFAILAVAGLGFLAWAVTQAERTRRTSTAGEDPGFVVPRGAVAAKSPLLRVEKRVLFVTNQVSWSQLESEDYPTYIERLRAIGCPEQTIRDIIIADLDKMMAPQLATVRRHRATVNYWEPDEEHLINDVDSREVSRRERELEAKKQTIVRELVGADLRRERQQQQGRQDYYERRLRFLPEDRRSAVRDVLEKFDTAEQDLRAKETDFGDALTLAEQQQLRVLRRQREAELTALLTPEEREQYELWMSPTANAVRFAFYDMSPSEQEFVAVYQARRQYESQWGEVEPALLAPAERAQMEQDRARMEESIRQQLGDSRYVEFKRGEDPDFHQLSALATRFKVSKESVTEVYNHKQVLAQFRSQVVMEPNLTLPQKQEALAGMAAETEKIVQGLLGDRAYRYYLRTGQGSWIRGQP